MLNLYPPSAHNVYKGVQNTYPPEVDAAAQQINEATAGLGTDEKTLTEVLGSKTPEQRFLISERYKALFGTDLKSLVKSETSGHYGKLLSLIATPLPEAECEILRFATKGAGTTERYIFPIIVGRTNVEITILKKTYFDVYGEDLAVLMNNELGGDFKKVIMASLQGALVDFRADFHTAAKAEEDADALYAAGQGRFGTDEEAFIKIIVTSPPEHLRNVNAIYSKKYNYTIIKAVEKEFGGDAKKALLFAVRQVLEPLELLAEYFESTMKGFGTDEEGLSSAVVRYHIVLPQIKEAYKKAYGKELRDRIHGEISGDYRALLLSIFDTRSH
ncbi:Annexin protein, partial [Globisporangium splendens]